MFRNFILSTNTKTCGNANNVAKGGELNTWGAGEYGSNIKTAEAFAVVDGPYHAISSGVNKARGEGVP